MSNEETAKVTDGRKDDAGKDRWDLVPLGSVREVVRVLTYGAAKYAPGNWQLVEKPRERYFAAVMRHLVAWHSGERVDPESRLPHLAHAGCCVLFLLWFERDRPMPEVVQRLFDGLPRTAHMRGGESGHA